MSEHEHTVGLSKNDVSSLRYERSRDAIKIDHFESDYLICKMIPEGSRVLDVGCGQGVLMELVRNMCSAEVVGIEPNKERALAAESRGLKVYNNFVSGDILATLGKFDVILFADVLEHLEDPHSMLMKVKPFLAINGKIVASVPNVAHWSVRLALLFGRFEYQTHGIMDATHLRWYTESNIRRLFSASGYDIETFRHSLGYWMPEYNIGLLKIVPSRIKRPLAKLGLRIVPRLFGCQHVISATIVGNTSTR